MGLVLFPQDGDVETPDISWSYGAFADFRRSLAQAEGFDLSGMWGFGGGRSWTEVSTVLEPLLDHPDDGGEDLSPGVCASMVGRLETIADQWARGDGQRSARDVEDVRQLVLVLRLCIEKDVPLVFL
ncbi:hypothetical protein [Streptomyces sp. NPDC001665]